MALTVLLGGARSAKSSLAVDIGMRHDGPVAFIATAPAVDDDMAVRIRRHQQERPPSWTTIEEPIDLLGALHSTDATLVIVDCLTLWTSNLLLAGHDDTDVLALADTAATSAATRAGDVVVVSNEVGMGVHPETELGRRYRDLLGWVNQRWTSAAHTSLLLVAGRALPLTDPWTHLGHLARTMQ